MKEIAEEQINAATNEYLQDIIEFQDRCTEHAEIDFYNGFQNGVAAMQPQWIEINHTDDCPNDNLDYWCEDFATGKVIVRHGYAIRIHNTKRYAKIIVPDPPKQ